MNIRSLVSAFSFVAYDKLHEIENEIHSLPDIGYASNMNKIAKQKGYLEAQKSSLVSIQWHPYFEKIDM